MTQLDESRFSSLLHEAAQAIALPEDGPRRVLAAAMAAPGSAGVDQPGPRRSARARRLRLGAAAASIVVATVLGTLGVVAARSSGPRPSAAGSMMAAPSGYAVFGQLSPVIGGRVTSSLATNDFKVALRGGSPGSGAVDSAKVVATGTISLRVGVGRVTSVAAALTQLAARLGGYVASSTQSGPSSAARATIVLRVPEARFGQLVSSVQRAGTVLSMSTHSTDVTGQYVDYLSQIAAAKASERQYLAIMAKATTISDVLAIQSQLNQIESQINQLEGARNLLANEASYGTLTVKLNDVAAKGRGSSIGHALHDSASGFVAAVDGLISAAGPAAFGLLCLAALLLLGRAGWRLMQRRRL